MKSPWGLYFSLKMVAYAAEREACSALINSMACSSCSSVSPFKIVPTIPIIPSISIPAIASISNLLKISAGRQPSPWRRAAIPTQRFCYYAILSPYLPFLFRCFKIPAMSYKCRRELLPGRRHQGILCVKDGHG